jgi:hypothetical protein
MVMMINALNECRIRGWWNGDGVDGDDDDDVRAWR